MGFIFGTLLLILQVLTLAIFASVILSWLQLFGMRISRYNPVVRIIEDISDLVLRPIRRHIPASAGGFDFSPMIALVVLWILQAILRQLAVRL